MGLDFDQLYPARFLKAGEFKNQDITLKITKVEIEELEGDKGKQVKGILSFHKTTKQLVLNKTNGLCIRAMFGRNTDDWIGKRVTFFPAKVEYGDSDLAIRVRGSPDIPANIDVEIKLARKKARTMTMQKTGAPGAAAKTNGGAAGAVPESKPVPPADATLPQKPDAAELFDQETGEVPFGADQ